MIRNGSRLRSQVCDGMVIVVKSTESLDDLRCGGVPMIPVGTEPTPGLALDNAFSGGAVMGKRYTDASGAEVLVTKGGSGSLSVGEIPLELKESKTLPASD